MEMVMATVELQFPSPQMKWVSHMLCDSSVVHSLYLRCLCCELYMGPFMKVAWFDLAKVVASGASGRYVRALPVPMVVKASNRPLRGFFDYFV
jgi:hypothetical protein